MTWMWTWGRRNSAAAAAAECYSDAVSWLLSRAWTCGKAADLS